MREEEGQGDPAAIVGANVKLYKKNFTIKNIVDYKDTRDKTLTIIHEKLIDIVLAQR